MKKLMALAIALLVIGMAGVAATSARAEEVGSQGWKPKIHTMSALGYGLATSQSNPMDFELLKIGIAGVDVVVANESEELKVGILYFGETRYKLKDIVIGNGSATANIYDSNSTQVGSISLNSYPKGDREVWAGTLTLNGVTYNAYIIQANRLLKAAEKADNVKEYCQNNPEKCKAAMKAVGQIVCDPTTDGNCRDRIKTFCEQYPDDNRCKVLGIAYCKLHLDDSNCRQELIDKCKLNNTDEACEKLGELYDKRVGKANESMKNAPGWLKVVRERIRDRLANPPLTNGPNNGPGAEGD